MTLPFCHSLSSRHGWWESPKLVQGTPSRCRPAFCASVLLKETGPDKRRPGGRRHIEHRFFLLALPGAVRSGRHPPPSSQPPSWSAEDPCPAAMPQCCVLPWAGVPRLTRRCLCPSQTPPPSHCPHQSEWQGLCSTRCPQAVPSLTENARTHTALAALMAQPPRSLTASLLHPLQPLRDLPAPHTGQVQPCSQASCCLSLPQEYPSRRPPRLRENGPPALTTTWCAAHLAPAARRASCPSHVRDLPLGAGPQQGAH